jgi:hypothetical protein
VTGAITVTAINPNTQPIHTMTNIIKLGFKLCSCDNANSIASRLAHFQSDFRGDSHDADRAQRIARDALLLYIQTMRDLHRDDSQIDKAVIDAVRVLKY